MGQGLQGTYQRLWSMWIGVRGANLELQEVCGVSKALQAWESVRTGGAKGTEVY